MKKVFSCIYNGNNIQSEKVLDKSLSKIGENIGEILKDNDSTVQSVSKLNDDIVSLTNQLASLNQQHDNLVKDLASLETKFNQKLKSIKAFLNDKIISYLDDLLIEGVDPYQNKLNHKDFDSASLNILSSEQLQLIRDFHSAFLDVQKTETALLEINTKILSTEQELQHKKFSLESAENNLPKFNRGLWEDIYRLFRSEHHYVRTIKPIEFNLYR